MLNVDCFSNVNRYLATMTESIENTHFTNLKNSRILTTFKTTNEFYFLNGKISNVMFIQIATFSELFT